MMRRALTISLVLALAACGKAARQSDDPAVGPTASSSQAVAQASAASAGEPPAAFRKCTICHATEPDRNLIGPSLAGMYGRKAATVPGYPYSAALRQAGLTWDDATLDRFLAAPMKAVPGTRMTFAGLKDPAERKDVIVHLKAL